MQVSEFHLTAYSTALFSTWIFIEELGLLFDAGDGLSAGLLQKARKVKYVFVSHADRDHLAGLLQFQQLNGRADGPLIHYPADSGSFPALEAFSQRFDPHIRGEAWRGIRSGDALPIRDRITVDALRNDHITAPVEWAKSLSYRVWHKKWKLRREYLDLPGSEIKDLIAQRGRAAVSEEVATLMVGYSGDTPVEDYGRWDGAKLLIHEAPFVRKEDQDRARNNRHSSLEEVLRMAAEIKIDQLVLSHFSSRYSAEEIDTTIRRYGREFRVTCPVYRLLPGQIHRDVLREEPVWSL